MPGMMANPTQRQFNPYSENGGTILAIAGHDFSVIAGDTRQTEGYNIQTRYAPKVFKLYVPFVSLTLSQSDPQIAIQPIEQAKQSWQSMASQPTETCS